ncbi:MAG: hypothetical protein ACOH5I_03495 [Oligoflexus sp.]
MALQRSRHYCGFMLLLYLMNACGIVGSKYIPYASGGAASVCPNALGAYSENLASVFTADNCSCHSATAPTISPDNAVNSNSFVQAASRRGNPQALVNYLVNGSHAGSAEAGDASAGLDAWATACAS